MKEYFNDAIHVVQGMRSSEVAVVMKDFSTNGEVQDDMVGTQLQSRIYSFSTIQKHILLRNDESKFLNGCDI